jgi:predicted metalloprotease
VNYKKKQAEERTGESAEQVVLVSQNHGIDSYWKRLGPESNGEYTHPQLSPEQKAAFAMSVGQLPSRKTNR